MKRKARPELVRLQDSVSYFSNTTSKNRKDIPNRSEHFGQLYVRMFIDDVRLSIMPTGRVSNRQFSISLEPQDAEISRVIEEAFSLGEYHHDLASAIRDFVAECATELLLWDTSTYEIVFLAEKEGGKRVGFELSHIRPMTLFRKRNTLVQEVPDEIAIKFGKPHQIELKPERLVTFKLPNAFRNRMDDLISSLASLSSPIVPDFYMNELASEQRKTPYDMKTHRHMRIVALASTTRLFGWNARSLFQQETLEYYLIHRILLFERFKIELRDTIVDTLNQGIKNAGKQLGFGAKVVLGGFPTLADVEAAFRHLQKGDATFTSILEPFRLY